jgi:diamine N-acetyltransferase
MKWLIGKKIRLRAIEPKDLDILMEWENDSENWKASGTLTPFSRDTMKKYVDNAHLNIYQAGQYRFMIETLEGRITVGAIDLFDFDPFHKRAGVGVLIGSKNDRRRGYSTESLSLLKHYCFEYLELRQLYCNILEDNQASKSLFENVGFKVCGVKKDWHRSERVYKDEYFLQIVNTTEAG